MRQAHWNQHSAVVAVRARSLSSLLAAAFVLVVAGCDRGPDPASLPAIPDVLTDSFPTAVRTQVDDAFEDLRARPMSARRNGRLAMILQTYKQFPVADIMYQRARAIDPDSFRWAYLHGIVHVANGQLENAESAFARAIEIDGDEVLARIRRAEVLADLGRSEDAAAVYAAVMPRVQDLSEARFSYGRFLVAEAEFELAIEEIRAAIRLSGDFGAAHYQLGLAQRSLGRTAEAERSFRIADRLRTRPADGSDRFLGELMELNRNEQPFVHRAKVLAASGRLEEARRFADAALERNPESLPAHASLMALAVRSRDFEAFERHRAAAMAIDEAHPGVWFNVGVARKAQERWGEAEAAFARSRELDPTDPNVHVQLAVLARRAERPEADIEASLREAVDLDPDHDDARWLLGELLSDSERPREAIPHLEAAVTGDHPHRGRIQVALARARARTGDGPGAHAALDAAERDANDRNDRIAAEAAAALRTAVDERLGPRPGGED